MDIFTLKDAVIKKLRSSPKIVVYLAATLVCIVLLLIMGRDTTPNDSVNDFPKAETEYAVQLERQLEAVISQIDGAGKTKVMVTVESTVSYEYATDDSYSESKYESEIVIIGSDKALIKRIDNPEVAGVLVICDGGDSAVIKEKILKAVATVLDISSNKVYITK